MPRRLLALVFALLLAGPAAAGAFEDGLAAAERGDYEEAVRLFSAAIEAGALPPRAVAYAYVNRGYARARLGDDRGAVEDYTAALDRAPELAEIYDNRASAYRRLADHERAAADFQEAIRRQPDDPDLHYNLGNTYLALGQHDRAVEAYTAALDRAPAAPAFVLNNRGIAHRRRGQADLALRDFDAAIRADPAYANAYYNRAMTYAALADRERALADLRQAAALAPDEPAFRERLAALEPPPPLPAPPSVPQEIGAVGGLYRARQDVNYRAGPDSGSPRLGVVDGGETVRVTGEVDGWLAIVRADGSTGYAYGGYFEPLP